MEKKLAVRCSYLMMGIIITVGGLHIAAGEDHSWDHHNDWQCFNLKIATGFLGGRLMYQTYA